MILSERLTIGLPQALVAVFCLFNKENNVYEKGVVEFSKSHASSRLVNLKQKQIYPMDTIKANPPEDGGAKPRVRPKKQQSHPIHNNELRTVWLP